MAEPSQMDPWAWQAWAATQDPGLYGWERTPISGSNLSNPALQSALREAGLWTPEVAQAADRYAEYERELEQFTRNYGSQGEPFYRQAPDISSALAPLAGYQAGDARSAGHYRLTGFFDPQGRLFGGEAAQRPGSSFRLNDYLTMAAILAGGYLGVGAFNTALAGGAAGVGGAAGAAGTAGGMGAAAAGGATAFPVASPGVIASTPLAALGAPAASSAVGPGLTFGGVSAAGAAPASMYSLGAGGGSLASSAAGGLGAAGSAAATGLRALATPQNLLGLGQIATSLYGLNLASDMRRASDPFAPMRPGYAAQLAELEANPSLITSRPGFEAGLMAIGRASAARGYAGSGNLLGSLQRFGGDFYNNEVARLATLAGAGATPGAGQAGAAQLASQSLAGLGYGIAPFLSNSGPSRPRDWLGGQG